MKNDFVPRENLGKRVAALREVMSKNEVECALISSPANIQYLSGFSSGEDANLLISHDRALLVTDFRYITQAKLESGDGGVAVAQKSKDSQEQDAFCYEIVRIEDSLTGTLSDAISDMEVESLYIEGENITYSFYEKVIKRLPITSVHDIGTIMYDLRAVKDDYELSLMKNAVKIADDAFAQILKFVKPGMTEKEIADELLYFLNKGGASGTSFDTIVVSGERTAMPHGKPSLRKIQNKDIVTIDFGAKYKGYCSDMTRTFFVGEPPKEMLETIYNIVNRARERAIIFAHGGVVGKDLDAVARDFISSQGYGEYFGHALGHGVGLEIHESPNANTRNVNPILPGSVVTIEPGIYLEGLGGVRIEDMILVTESGCEVLTETNRDLVVL